jgi:hypothetical protein
MLVACACRLGRAAHLALLALALSSCTSKVSLREDAEPRASFAATSERWTRLGRVMATQQELGTGLLLTVTLRSRAFQRAYSERYAAVFRISDPAERARIEGDALASAGPGLSFWIESAAPSASWNDLRSEPGRWRLALLDDEGRELRPEKIEQIPSRDLQQQLEVLGKPRDPYAKLWLVRFPAQTGDGQPLPRPTSRKIILRVAGPLGQTDLTWALY